MGNKMFLLVLLLSVKEPNTGLQHMATGTWRMCITELFSPSVSVPLVWQLPLPLMAADGAQVLKTTDVTTWGAIAAPALPLHCWWLYDLWGVWLAESCLQLGIFLWCELALFEHAANCSSHWHRGNLWSVLSHPSADIRETWRRCWGQRVTWLLHSPSNMMSLGHTNAEQNVAFHHQTTIKSSKMCPAAQTPTTLQRAVSTALC